ncbi:PREDICTED: PAX3- and PAX7-binding protein 1 [Nicrophorus vespilloides]|uniref:PAX3- and PAX7-binding protein 1 n=1 Tax=Nicrophorus vespilloides TaxID=110193 RepID=A0ABM1MU91_NICVS|nr:PREDICTED: PAX3- and PAX7-binding protein 1 [Nicrophorus vespilloides]
MSLFRKPKKSIQRRVFSEQNDDEDEMESKASEAPKASKEETKKKEKSKKDQKKQSLLSFETEEEGEEVFQVKKSSHSKKMMRMYEKERKKKEAKDLKIKDEENKIKNKCAVDVSMDNDLVIVVNHKIPSPPPAPILSGRDALCAGKDDMSSDDEDVDVNHRFSKPDNFKRVLESGAIPDAAMIHAARKKRQRARELGDFVPIEDEEPEDKGRHIREDENDGSDEERIDMGANPVKRDQERRREQFYEAQDSDQEVNEWEDQQIRKGVTGAIINHELAYNEYNNLLQTQTQYQQNVYATKIDPGVPRTPEAILAKLKEEFEITENRKIQHERQLRQVQDDLIDVAEELTTLKIGAPKAAEKFRFYQELRGYITDLVECLDEKVAVITLLEQKAIELMAKKSDRLMERRRQDVRDQADEVTNLSKRSLGQRAPEDEEKMRRAVEREGRRTRRRRARESTGEPRHVEGMSSDDEIPQQESLYFDNEREQINVEVNAVFEDVVDDYSSIASILIKFEQWRLTDMSVYTEAYATLCLPKVVSPLVRLNLIFWDPLTDTKDLEKMDWYRTLALYGLHDDETENSLSKDPDLNLLPTLIEKIIIPKITVMIEKCWDPLSSSETLRLVGVVGRYIRKYPTLGPDSKALHNLFNAVLNKIKTSLEHDVFIPIMPRLAETKNPFFQRQFASGLKLLRNITSWQGILNDNTLKELAINALLNKYLISGIKVSNLIDATAKIQLVNLILPRVWLQGNQTHLQMFINCAMQLAQQLDKDNPLHLESIELINNIIKQ